MNQRNARVTVHTLKEVPPNDQRSVRIAGDPPGSWIIGVTSSRLQKENSDSSVISPVITNQYIKRALRIVNRSMDLFVSSLRERDEVG